ncbi:MAG TPA: outer membrane lipoprotein carrier protein LolA [Candidatus Binatia bacterium]|jgi:outer membrane lipoprotein carrier protein
MPEKSRLSRILFSALSLLAASSLFIASPEPSPAAEGDDQIVDQLQKSYDSITDFTADFQQETEYKTLNKTIKAHGKVSYKRPGKMLWKFDEPKNQWVLADGQSLYFYQPENKQVLKTPLKNAFRSSAPLTFLLGIGNLKRDFKATSKGVEGNLYVLQLGPKDGSIGGDEITLGVDKQNYQINWARIKDPGGNLTTVHFINMRRGVGVNDSIFRLQVPQGADVVDVGTQQ